MIIHKYVNESVGEVATFIYRCDIQNLHISTGCWKRNQDGILLGEVDVLMDMQ